MFLATACHLAGCGPMYTWKLFFLLQNKLLVSRGVKLCLLSIFTQFLSGFIMFWSLTNWTSVRMEVQSIQMKKHAQHMGLDTFKMCLKFRLCLLWVSLPFCLQENKLIWLFLLLHGHWHDDVYTSIADEIWASYDVSTPPVDEQPFFSVKMLQCTVSGCFNMQGEGKTSFFVFWIYESLWMII